MTLLLKYVQNCAIGTISDSASSWLCNLSYATAGVGFFVALLLVAPVVAVSEALISSVFVLYVRLRSLFDF